MHKLRIFFKVVFVFKSTFQTWYHEWPCHWGFIMPCQTESSLLITSAWWCMWMLRLISHCPHCQVVATAATSLMRVTPTLSHRVCVYMQARIITRQLFRLMGLISISSTRWKEHLRTWNLCLLKIPSFWQTFSGRKWHRLWVVFDWSLPAVFACLLTEYEGKVIKVQQHVKERKGGRDKSYKVEGTGKEIIIWETDIMKENVIAGTEVLI